MYHGANNYECQGEAMMQMVHKSYTFKEFDCGDKHTF